MGEIMWTLEHEADIASDLSAFHRIDDPMRLDGPRYFMLAVRLAAYTGVMQARLTKEMQEEREGGTAPHTASRTASSPSRPSRVSSDSALAMLAADGWAEYDTTKEG